MVGTLINIGTIVLGSVIGVLIGGLITFIETTNPLVPLGGLLIGALLGEWWKVEEGLEKVGFFLRKKFIRHDAEEGQQARFVEGFVTASLVFVIGPIAILGSIQDGLTGNFEMLAIKAILDGFASIAFASSLGIGVVFSALSILVYQGSITLLAGFFSRFFSTAMMNEMTAVGGLVLMAIAISSLLAIKKIRTGSFLPALLVTPLIVFVLEKFFGGL